MRVRVYEEITATQPDDGGSMYREGRAMRDALIADLRKIACVEVVVDGGVGEGVERELDGDATPHPNPPPQGGREQSPAPPTPTPSPLRGEGWGGGDGGRGAQDEPEQKIAFVIAPETGGILERCVSEFRVNHSVIASSPEALALTADKLALSKHWQRHGVRTPTTMPFREWPTNRRPAVFKPLDGAGSCGTFLVKDEENYRAAWWAGVNNRFGELIAQDYLPGQPASVSFLVSHEEVLALPPTLQHLSTDGRFSYLGGETIADAALVERAIQLAWQAIECVPGLFGYVGVDLILGNATDGSQDFAIEINPRFTTSYVGLREAVDFNIAEYLLTMGTFAPRASLRVAAKWRHVSFTADGSVQID